MRGLVYSLGERQGPPDYLITFVFGRWVLDRWTATAFERMGEYGDLGAAKAVAETDDMTRDGTVSADMTQEWFDPGEAAEYLRVTRSTIYRWTREGRLRVHKLPTGGGSRYRREDLDALLMGEGEDRTAN